MKQSAHKTKNSSLLGSLGDDGTIPEKHVVNMQLIDVNVTANANNRTIKDNINKRHNPEKLATRQDELLWKLPKIDHRTMTTCDIHLIDYSSSDYQKSRNKIQCLSCGLCIIIVLLFYILSITLFNEALELIPQLIFWMLCACLGISSYYFRKRSQLQMTNVNRKHINRNKYKRDTRGRDKSNINIIDDFDDNDNSKIQYDKIKGIFDKESKILHVYETRKENMALHMLNDDMHEKIKRGRRCCCLNLNDIESIEYDSQNMAIVIEYQEKKYIKKKKKLDKNKDKNDENKDDVKDDFKDDFKDEEKEEMIVETVNKTCEIGKWAVDSLEAGIFLKWCKHNVFPHNQVQLSSKPQPNQTT